MAQDPAQNPANQETRFGSVGDKPADLPLKKVEKSEASDDRENKLGAQTIRNIMRDQGEIWKSPAHLRLGQADWLVPFAGITAGFLVTDHDASLHLSNSPKTLKNYTDFSNYGMAVMAGGVGGLYLWGRATHDPHKREAGILSGEAAVDGLLVATALKYATGRERPDVDSSRGKFWQGGTSFPSSHATAAWAIASVLTHEYPGPITKILAYGAATAITVARVEGKNHFPADAFVGSGIGWLAGWQVYRAHHNPELGGGIAERLSGSPLVETERTPSAMGSPYVPLDSWIYPILDRLMALGTIDDALLGMKPWTRLECARLVSEAGERLQDEAAGTEAERLYDSVRQEFLRETELLSGGSNRATYLESVYTRATQISGPPLTDGYHFGQTLINDFGRPFQEGFNSVAGFSGWATAGRWVVYLRGEYEHSPDGPAVPPSTEAIIAAVDLNPVFPSSPVPSRNQARLLDTYVGLNLANWQISYGQESQWWSPSQSGPLLFSDNAYPIRMFHINKVSPFRLPGLFKFLGPTRWDAFFGTLQGHQTSPGPFMHGEKISFKPTRNLEFGFSRTVILGGAGLPLTPDRLLRSYFSATSANKETPATDPGKRSGGFDVNYRVPYLRNWLTIYTDSLADDDPSPIAAPLRAGIIPGIYLSHFPGLQKLDLRVEAPLTNTILTNGAGHYIYWDGFYHDLYTNRGYLMGNWVGRDGSGIASTSRYWLSARNAIQFGYRHAKVDVKFIPQGGTINDGSVRAEFWLKRDWETSALVQYEQWRFPVLAPGLQRNVTASVQLNYWPRPGKQ
ncbi:MAG TPA: capsule assembly Wzi family protein [Candidatus Acidoferrum sp.]|nr:capsule assembly Wzi family protein [Candidatus Acidoferrum sp.]